MWSEPLCSPHSARTTTYHVSLTSRATQDIQAVASRILKSAPTQGAEWLDGLENAVASLEDFPERCGQAPESPGRNGETIRQLLYGSKPNVYRVLFTVDDEKKRVFVLALRHSRQAAAKGL